MLRKLFADFRPRPVPTIISACGVALLLALGTWQVFRLVEKNEINAFRAERASAPPVALPARIDDPQGWAFRRVAVTGTFAHDRELYVNARSQRGNAGYQVVTPLLRADGPPVLVSRGWVPYERKDPAGRTAGQVAGPVTVEGILRTEPRKGWLMPANSAERNEWFWFDLPAMAQAAGVPDAARFYIEAGPQPNPGGFPIGGQTQVQLPSNHLGYALTWYALAVALVAIYIASQRAPRADRSPGGA
jgi:surfeit locus 1 family protein